MKLDIRGIVFEADNIGIIEELISLYRKNQDIFSNGKGHRAASSEDEGEEIGDTEERELRTLYKQTTGMRFKLGKADLDRGALVVLREWKEKTLGGDKTEFTIAG